MTDFDATEVLQLAADLGEVPDRAIDNVRKAIQVTSQNIKDDWRSAATRTGLTSYARSVSYETQVSSTEVSSEIGPDPTRRQGRMGFVEEAHGGVKSRPQNAGRDALKANEEDFENGLAKAIGDIL